MCGRYTLTSQEGLVEDLEAALDPAVPKNVWWKARYNVAPTQDAPVVALHDGVRTLEMMRWGLVPFWAGRDGKKAPLMINARVETLDAKPMYRDAFHRRRCLVPADGFFEWLHAGKQATPMYIHPEPRRFIAFAGLWSRTKSETGDLHSFTIITGPPNALVAPIHDRMPIVLDRSAWAAWLDPALPPDGARALLAMPSDHPWRAEPVSPWVNKTDHDDPKCIEPAAPPPPVQGSLF
jgi:putative SOS response-associated peptidase YedK